MSNLSTFDTKLKLFVQLQGMRCRSINQSINQVVSQSVNQSINQSINQSVSQSVNQSINQSISQSVSQSVNQSINQSQRSSVLQSLFQLLHPLGPPSLIPWGPRFRIIGYMNLECRRLRDYLRDVYLLPTTLSWRHCTSCTRLT